jgi:hypothetical protein
VVQLPRWTSARRDARRKGRTDSLGRFGGVKLSSLVPVSNERLPDTQGLHESIPIRNRASARWTEEGGACGEREGLVTHDSLISSKIVDVEGLTSERGGDVVHDRLNNRGNA